jgi:CDP-diacylglycerol--glycerol-3-phosphate 3-phosphatidyltransferase
MNLPNGITLARIFLVPFIVVVLLTTRIPHWDVWGVSLFLAAALTDLLDGHLARRRKQVTTLGRLLDPIADKLLISAALISLVQLQLAPAWMVVIIIGREFAVSGLRSIAAGEGFTIEASSLGKGKMVLQVAAIVGLILARSRGGWIPLAATVLMWAVVILALASMAHYFMEFWSRISSSIKYREHRRLQLRERRRLIMAELRELRRLHRANTQRRRARREARTTAIGSVQDPG